MANNQVRVYSTDDGTPVDMWSVDAVEAVASGAYTMTPPPAKRGQAFQAPPAPEASAPHQEQAVEAESLRVETDSGVQAESGTARATRRPSRG